MVIGYHVVFSTYGFWLPNDPRGSWSEFVGSWKLLRFGPATKIETRQSVAHTPHDHRRRLAAKRALKHPFESHILEGERPPSVWGRGCWKAYLDRKSEVRRAVEYVENNPLKEGKRRQHWSFVTPFGD